MTLNSNEPHGDVSVHLRQSPTEGASKSSENHKDEQRKGQYTENHSRKAELTWLCHPVGINLRSVLSVEVACKIKGTEETILSFLLEVAFVM